MPFDWRQYLVIADEFAVDPREELQRSSISRAYYCVYHLGLAYASTQNFKATLPDLHRKLWAWYTSQSDTKLRQLGNTGLRLKLKRQKADYDDNINRLSDELKVSLQWAHEFTKALP